jgi:hypothetical protein
MPLTIKQYSYRIIYNITLGTFFIYGKGIPMSMTITQPIFDYIYQHLTEFHSNKMRVVNHFAYDFDEYMKMLSYAKQYISHCEHFLGDACTADGNDELPFVIFNSIIRLSSDNGEDWSCCIVLPKAEFENSLIIANVTPIRCNSPESYELLLKQSGESAVIEKDGKTNTYTIKSIETNPYIPMVQNEKWYMNG